MSFSRTKPLSAVSVSLPCALVPSSKFTTSEPSFEFAVSIAEIVVCWAVIGTSFESLANRKAASNNSKAIPILIGAVVASVLFGVYHFAHSPPFNEVNMVLFLMIPAIAPSGLYFLGRDIYAAIIIQNFRGIFGVMQTIDIQAYRQPLFQMYILTIPAIAALIVANIKVMRKKIMT